MRFSADLLSAITLNQIEPFKDLLAKDPINIRQTDDQGRLLLHWATQEDAFDIVDWLAGETPELINHPDHDGQSPLRIAAGEGHVVTVSVLLEKGAAGTHGGAEEVTRSERRSAEAVSGAG